MCGLGHYDLIDLLTGQRCEVTSDRVGDTCTVLESEIVQVHICSARWVNDWCGC